MANEYAVNAVDLQAVAEAIRQKTGKTDSLQFPDGFVSEVGAIQSAEGVTLQLKGLIDGTATEITIPDGVTEIRTNVFNWHTALVNVHMPDGITKIGDNAFYGCKQLALTVLPEELTYIGSGAFDSCQKLVLTVLPAGLKTISNTAFYSCSGLKNITFKGTPDYISNRAFSGCNNLKTINVPWAEGAVASAPWGATKATINYNYTGG